MYLMFKGSNSARSLLQRSSGKQSRPPGSTVVLPQLFSSLCRPHSDFHSWTVPETWSQSVHHFKIPCTTFHCFFNLSDSGIKCHAEEPGKVLHSVGTSALCQAALSPATSGKAPSSVCWKVPLSIPGVGRVPVQAAWTRCQPCSAGGLTWDVLLVFGLPQQGAGAWISPRKWP